ncbi:MAG: hypothetical protein ACRDRH_24610 [Pseudonocardia sp.]
MNLDLLATTYRTIVLDGCDGAGKTTLAQRLSTAHRFTAVHSARTPDGTDLLVHYRGILARPGRLVLDRCFVSELVYGPLRHRRSRITLTQAVELAETVVARDGTLIHLTGTPSAIYARLRARDDDTAATPTEVAELVTAYEHVFAAITAQLPGHVLRIDTTTLPSMPG